MFALVKQAFDNTLVILWQLTGNGMTIHWTVWQYNHSNVVTMLAGVLLSPDSREK